MKLERARELYSDYAEGTLTPAMRLALEQHWEADSSARADYDQFAQVFALLGAPAQDEVAVPLGFRAKVLELASIEAARREAQPSRRAARSFTDWLGTLTGRRRATGGALAALAALAVGGVFLHTVNGHGPTVTNLGPSFPRTTSSLAPTVVHGVSTATGTDGNLYHVIHVHLPPGVPRASVMAYVITSTDQIADPAVRAQQAMPALKQPQELTNGEELQIPIALLRNAPAGTTLNLLVQWTPDDPAQAPGAQVIFTPVQAPGAASAPVSFSDSGNLYDALQDIASADNVTVIADAASAPTATVTDAPAGSATPDALKAVAAQVGYAVQPLSADTYQVYPKL